MNDKVQASIDHLNKVFARQLFYQTFGSKIVITPEQREKMRLQFIAEKIMELARG